MNNKKYIDSIIPIDDLFEAGFLKSKTDYDHIEKRICVFFGLKNIFEYSGIMNRAKQVEANLNTFSEN